MKKIFFAGLILFAANATMAQTKPQPPKTGTKIKAIRPELPPAAEAGNAANAPGRDVKPVKTTPPGKTKEKESENNDKQKANKKKQNNLGELKP